MLFSGRALQTCRSVPSLAASLHLIGQRDIIGPDIELPLPESQHPTVHPAAVDAHTHVHIDPGHLPYQSGETSEIKVKYFYNITILQQQSDMLTAEVTGRQVCLMRFSLS